MVFALRIMQPSSHTKDGLVGRQEMLGFRRIDETDGVQKICAVGLPFELAEYTC
jgi:hypothetical protein